MLSEHITSFANLERNKNYVSVDNFSFSSPINHLTTKFSIIAHRGASGYAPENTMAAFEMAVNMGVAGIELDVHQTADEKIVVIHDETLERTTNGKGDIASRSAAEISELDAGSWYEPSFGKEKVPLLEDVLDTFSKKIKIIVEVKSSKKNHKHFEKNVYEVIRKCNALENCTISSIHQDILDNFHKLKTVPRLAKVITPAEILHSFWKRTNKNNSVNQVQEVHPHWSLVSKNFLKKANEAQLEVFAWTVNKESIAKKMLSAGVNGIMTDYPDMTQNRG